jgi:cytochrome c
MYKLAKIFIVLVLSIIICSGKSPAEEKATRSECEIKCKEAAKLITEKGLDAGLEVLNDKGGPFVWKDSYVWCIDLENGMNLSHAITPGLIGKNLMGIKDVNGKMFFAEFVEVAKNKGEGWVAYAWPKPGEKNPSPKVTYVFRVPGKSLAMAAGIYE